MNLLHIHRQGKHGLANYDGEEILPPTFEYVGPPHPSVITASKNGVDYGLIKPTSGDWMCTPNFSYIFPWMTFNRIGAVAQNGLRGFLNCDGNWVVDPIYEYVSHFNEGRACIAKTERYGFIDTEGDKVSDLDQIEQSYYNEGFAVFPTENGFGYRDLEGKLVIESTYEFASPFYDGLAVVLISDGPYLIDKFEQRKSPCLPGLSYRRQQVVRFKESEERSGLLNLENQRKFGGLSDTLSFSRGHSLVKLAKEQHWSSINREFEITPLKCVKEAAEGGNGFFQIRMEVKPGILKWGYWSAASQAVCIDPVFEETEKFQNGAAEVRTTKHYGYIDTLGNWLWREEIRFED